MLITIARFSFPYEAYLAKGLLDIESIPAFVADEHTISMNWLYSNALGGVRLQVPAQFECRARKIVTTVQYDTDNLFGDYVGTCSHCGGKNWSGACWVSAGPLSCSGWSSFHFFPWLRYTGVGTAAE